MISSFKVVYTFYKEKNTGQCIYHGDGVLTFIVDIVFFLDDKTSQAHINVYDHHFTLLADRIKV